jgi:dihydroflavonol-4-reductase
VNAKSPIAKVIVTSSGKAIFEGNTKQVHFDESHWLATNNAGFYGKEEHTQLVLLEF